MLVETSGRRWSSERITTRPLGNVYFSNLIVGVSLCAAVAATEVLGFTGAFFGGVFLDEVWPAVFTTMTATANETINKRLQNADIISFLLAFLTLYLNAAAS